MKHLSPVKQIASLFIAFAVGSLFFFLTASNSTGKSDQQAISQLSSEVANLKATLIQFQAQQENLQPLGTEDYIGEISMFAGNFAPRGWAFCEGQLLSIASNTALFSILGTTYGGDGRTTFALPDLRGRVPMHPSTNFRLGDKGGAESNNLVLKTQVAPINIPPAPVKGDIKSVAAAGSNLNVITGIDPVSDSNLQPYTCINYIICVQGIFPPRS